MQGLSYQRGIAAGYRYAAAALAGRQPPGATSFYMMGGNAQTLAKPGAYARHSCDCSDGNPSINSTHVD